MLSESLAQPSQDLIVTLMFMSGLLFLGLNLLARHLVHPGPPGSKQLGYTLILAVVLAWMVTYQHQIMVDLGFLADEARKLLLFGLAMPVLFASLVWYRIQKARKEKAASPGKSSNEPD